MSYRDYCSLLFCSVDCPMCISAQHGESTFDVALCGVIAPPIVHDESIFAEILRLLKPQGKLILAESQEGNSSENIMSRLRLSGFIDIKDVWI